MDFNGLKNVKISGAFVRFSLLTYKKQYLRGKCTGKNYAP